MIRQLLILVFFAASIASAQAADRLCPDIDTLRAETPETMAGVQADIDRMKLCVERAQLLRQLDDIAQQRQEILNKVTNPNAHANNFAAIPIPTLPVSALPPLQPVEVDKSQPAASVQKSWKVRKIWGQGGAMRAQLAQGDTLLNVVRGDALPDGAVVESLTVRGVTLSHNGKISDLEWEQEAASASGNMVP